jgi:hypothetical protein
MRPMATGNTLFLLLLCEPSEQTHFDTTNTQFNKRTNNTKAHHDLVRDFQTSDQKRSALLDSIGGSPGSCTDKTVCGVGACLGLC